ncbi:unnamed protein product, partial [Polarella glacialis]
MLPLLKLLLLCQSLSAGSEALWLDQLVQKVWPRVDKWVQQMVEEQVKPQICESLPSVLRDRIKFKDMTLGCVSPQFGPLIVREREKGTVVLDVGVYLASDMDMSISIAGLDLGIRKFYLSGTMSVVFRPPSEKPPFFGGMEIYFVNPPEVDLDFTGLASVAECPGLRGRVRTAINDVMNNFMTLPQRIPVDLCEDDDVDLADLRFPMPLGILRITLLSAEDLPAADFDWHHAGKSFKAVLAEMVGLSHLTGEAREASPGQPLSSAYESVFKKNQTSDPFVVISLGQKKWESAVMRKTTSPDWSKDCSDSSNVADMAVYEMGQNVSIGVWDYDNLSTHDHLGGNRVLVSELVRFAGDERGWIPLDHTLSLERAGVKSGSLKLRASLLRLNDIPRNPAEVKDSVMVDGPSQMFFSAKILGAVGLPANGAPPYVLRVTIGRDTVDSGGDAVKEIQLKSKGSTAMVGATAVAEELRRVCCNLAQKGLPPKQIASVVGVSEMVVAHAIGSASADSDDDESSEATYTVQEIGATHPEWDEVLSALLPWPLFKSADLLLELKLELVDSHGKVVGTSAQQPLSLKDVLCNSESPGLLSRAFRLAKPVRWVRSTEALSRQGSTASAQDKGMILRASLSL